MNASATLAHSITWASSKQSYLTARLLADRDLVDDCLRAYAYFRWADNIIDASLCTRDERIAFIERQKYLVEMFYRMERPGDLLPEEEMLADLIGNDRKADSGLQSFIRNFMAVLEFDANRDGRLVSGHELAAYSAYLGTAVMDGIQYFIGNGHPYPKTHDRKSAVMAAHMTHMLRDMLEDMTTGLFNIPNETLAARGISITDVDSEPFRDWVRGQVGLARLSFRKGKRYIDTLEVLRCKLAGYWYCTRFENILDAIERDGYILRAEYPERRKLAAWIGMAWLGILVIGKHYAGRVWRALARLTLRARWVRM